MYNIRYLIKSKIALILRLPKYIRYLGNHDQGLCTICGRDSLFLLDKENKKESYHCIYCNAWLRLRYFAMQILKLYAKKETSSLKDLAADPSFSSLHIYEAQSQGPIHNILYTCPNYVCSEYFDNVKSGEYVNNVRCEDLQNLSFADNSLDLILHTSVLEHVRKPIMALEESYRVLKSGGYLIFEVPMTDPWVDGIRKKSVKRVDTSSDKDNNILEPVYHGDPIRSKGALVYVDHGLDLIEKLRRLDFEVEISEMPIEKSLMSHVVVFICKKA